MGYRLLGDFFENVGTPNHAKFDHFSIISTATISLFSAEAATHQKMFTQRSTNWIGRN
jgi:hypothetical protein